MVQDINREFNVKYLLNSYLIGLVWGAAILIPTILAGADNASSVTTGVILSGILFPFAKLVYDLLIGFKLTHKIKHSNFRNNVFIDRMIFFFYLIIFILSIPLAPFGIVYLLVKWIRSMI